jgi:hypothetical protein
VRFLGRRVYVAVVVVLLSALRHGVTPERAGMLREKLGVDRRTLERWRRWWLESFVRSRFWRAVRGAVSPGLRESELPWSLCEAYGIETRNRLLDLLKFLSPSGGSDHLFEHGF